MEWNLTVQVCERRQHTTPSQDMITSRKIVAVHEVKVLVYSDTAKTCARVSRQHIFK